MQSKYFLEELGILKSILDKTPMKVAIKWGGEVYTYQEKNVVSYGGFKNHFCLWFHHGVFLKDPYLVLTNANEEKTKALRQWRFYSKDEIDEDKILEYVLEAIENAKNGLLWKPVKSEMPEMPDLLLQKLNKDAALKTAFEHLAPFKQKEYIEYISSAKQEKTRVSRLEKCVLLILDGKGLNDKYR